MNDWKGYLFDGLYLYSRTYENGRSSLQMYWIMIMVGDSKIMIFHNTNERTIRSI